MSPIETFASDCSKSLSRSTVAHKMRFEETKGLHEGALSCVLLNFFHSSRTLSRPMYYEVPYTSHSIYQFRLRVLEKSTTF